MKGKLIVIEGSDSSGKETQSLLLVKNLRKKGFKVRYFDFPYYDSCYGKIITKYLKGGFGDTNKVDAYTISLVYAFDRLLKRKAIVKALESGYVVCNRYVASNMAHQCVKFKDKKKRKKFIDWLDNLEYNINRMPRPDITFYLYVPVSYAQKLIKARKPRDKHETNIPYLRKVEKVYLELAKQPKWKKIDCVKRGEMLSRSDVSNIILKEV